MDCLFCKIVANEIPATIVYEDELLLAFDDITPQIPIHKLIIPKQHINTINDISPQHHELLGKMVSVATELAKKADIDQAGYRILMNCNRGGGQTVYHIHLHLLGGRQMSWPPG